MIHRSSLVVLVVSAALAACGGKGGGKDTTPAPAGGPPFDQEAVKAAIGATATGDGCSYEDAATVADALRAQREMMQADGGVEESFSCKASVLTDGQWECTWEVWQKSSGAADPDDPCGGEGGSGYQAIAQVNADGTLVAGQLVCIAPG